jgi:prevent-host-death family protein
MKQLGSEEARRRFRDLLDDAQRGESAEISRNGKAIAVLVPAEWYEHQRAALAAFAEAAWGGGDPPVSAREVRVYVTRLAGLLDGMRKYIHPDIPKTVFADYWDHVNKAVVGLAGLLPENAEEEQR